MTTPAPAEDLLDAQGVADRLGVKRESVLTYQYRGLTPSRRIGRTPVWTPADVDAWAAQRPGRGKGGDYEKRSRNQNARAGVDPRTR